MKPLFPPLTPQRVLPFFIHLRWIRKIGRSEMEVKTLSPLSLVWGVKGPIKGTRPIPAASPALRGYSALALKTH